MSAFTRFLKENKKERPNAKYAASTAFTDEKGNPLEWEIRPITTAENERFRDACIKKVKDKKGITRSELDTRAYTLKLITASVVEPNLNSSELQDSYGVMGAEELIVAMLDNPGEYDKLGAFIAEFNGFNKSIDDDIEEAKN
jgi:hypothetical protein